LYLWLLVAIVRYREDMSAWFLMLELGLLTLIVPGSCTPPSPANGSA
jgi:hypothetical protein